MPVTAGLPSVVGGRAVVPSTSGGPGLPDRRSGELFLGACGASGPIRLLVEAPGERRPTEIVLTRPFAVVGREPLADVHLDHPQVSRRHAYLQVAAGRLFWFDLGSRSGTVGALGSRPAGRLALGDGLGVGPFTIRLADLPGRGVHDDPEVVTPLSPRFAGQGALPDAALEIRSESGGSHVYRPRQALTLVGRSPGCQVALGGLSVSRTHFALVLTPLGLWAVDLLGRGGIAVGDARVRFARLDAGDVLLAGRYRFRVRGDEEPAGPGAEEEFISVADAATPAVLAPSEAESLIAPLVQQFGRMQDQMFSQFSSLLMAAFQMFGALQREQIDSLRSELDQIRRLVEETAELKAARVGASISLPAPPPRPAHAPEPPPRRDRRPRPRPKPLDPEVHALLDRRIASMEQESQRRWSSLLHTILGGNGAPRV